MYYPKNNCWLFEGNPLNKNSLNVSETANNYEFISFFRTNNNIHSQLYHCQLHHCQLYIDSLSISFVLTKLFFQLRNFLLQLCNVFSL